MTTAPQRLHFDGRVAVVAGGAGAIGSAIAHRLLEAGAHEALMRTSALDR